MVNLSWCKKQIRGIELIDKKEHLSKYYLKEVQVFEEELVKKFILKCELILDELNDNKINEIRGELNEK